jgi:hypothetical protein
VFNLDREVQAGSALSVADLVDVTASNLQTLGKLVARHSDSIEPSR